jgi:hypothetical protein
MLRRLGVLTFPWSLLRYHHDCQGGFHCKSLYGIHYMQLIANPSSAMPQHTLMNQIEYLATSFQ